MITLNFAWKRVHKIFECTRVSKLQKQPWFFIGNSSVHNAKRVDFRNLTFVWYEDGVERRMEIRVEGEDIAVLHEWSKPK